MPEDKQTRLFPPLRLIVLAALAGLAVGAAAVYVTGGLERNMPADAPQAIDAAATPQDTACAAKAETAKAVAASATGGVAAMLPADPPRSLASLAFNDPSGKPMTLADRSGKTVLLNLWATWCAPCRAEMPALDTLQREKGSDAFEVIAVNVDTGDDTKPRKFLEETNVHSLAYYRENTLSLFESLKKQGLALGLPVTLLIDKEGCLVASMNGPAEWSGADAHRLVDKALGG
ncbi:MULTISPECIES: thiol:disulfide interchange protein TlpA [Mesorhizobium]|uniref:TlpA family protein disulfide reductase n=1 Tax=Mesorhizobium denitrificans TaxID=2294114 RepID=A0A371XFB0_9HYPH|nr:MULTISPECIES: TlpA disulfide reductase family protein [Mesorhizobium]RFC67917.1 TlpA family protein disulfide reductase [Mesorhizobium denitrificans]